MPERNELAFLKYALGVTAVNPQEQTALENLMFERLLAAGFTVSSTGVVGFASGTLSANGWFNVKAAQYGAIGNGVANDTAAILLAAAAANAAGGVLFFPAGTYLTTANIPITASVRVMGDGKALSHIKATGACTRILEFTGTLVRCQVEDLYLDCNAVATSGIYGVGLSHSTFRSVQISGAKAVGTNPAAIMIGDPASSTGGWDNTFIDVDINGCAADGIFLMGVCNSTLFAGCKIFGNVGSGIVASSSNAVKVVGCTIESNAACGIFCVGGVMNIDIDDCYFLSNAATGLAFTTPATTVRCDVLLNGNTRVAMGNTGSLGARISNCYSYPYNATQTSMVFAAGYDGLTVENCALDPGNVAAYGIVPLMASHWSTNVNRLPHWTVANNVGFGKTVDFLGVSGVLEYDPRDLHINTVPVRNFVTPEMPFWVNVGAGSASTWVSATTTTVNGVTVPVWNLHSTAAGTSNIFGFTIDSALYTDLWGKYVMFGCWTKADATDKGANVYVGTAVQNNGNAATTNWTWKSGIFLWPTSGNVTFGAIKHGTATGDVYFAAPILMELGADYYELYGRVPAIRTWTTPTFDAAMFTASTGAWTVIAGNVTTLTYEIVGKTMRVHFFIDATNVTGAAASLKITIPASLSSRKRQIGTLLVQDAGGAAAMSNCEVQASGTTIDLYKAPNAGANWTITAGSNTRVQGFIEFEVV